MNYKLFIKVRLGDSRLKATALELTLPPSTLYNLYNFTADPLRAPNMPKPASNREAELLRAFTNNSEQYGFELAETVERLIGKTIPFGTLYTTLDRMKEKGYITVRMGETGKNRGGKRKKFYKITASGTRALQAYEFLNANVSLGGA